MGSKILGSKFSEDRSNPHILSTCALSPNMLSCSAVVIANGPVALPLKIRVLISSFTEEYDSTTEPRITASVTRTASLITKTLSSSPSGPNNSLRTGCKASLAEKSLSFLPCTSRFSSLFHLKQMMDAFCKFDQRHKLELLFQVSMTIQKYEKGLKQIYMPESPVLE